MKVKFNGCEKLQSTEKNKIFINEVVTRDGFQSESKFIPTDEKIEFINNLSNLGFAKIEVSSFVSPKAIPALSDALEVFAGINRNPNVKYTALIPNMRGLECALIANVDEVNLVMSASEAHNRSNLNRSREDSMNDILEMSRVAQEHKTSVNVSLSTAFGCPFEGNVLEEELFQLLDELHENAIENITLCDTTGMAFPSLVDKRLKSISNRYQWNNMTLHFHNTRGMGLANGLVALQNGIRSFDSSLGELGGCPYAPGATGNVCTEELAYMFELMGWNTGLDFKRIIETARVLERLIERPLTSRFLKAGMI